MDWFDRMGAGAVMARIAMGGAGVGGDDVTIQNDKLKVWSTDNTRYHVFYRFASVGSFKIYIWEFLFSENE